MDWSEGDLVWFDPGVGHPIPGEIQEVHRAAQVIVVQAVIKGKVNIKKIENFIKTFVCLKSSALKYNKYLINVLYTNHVYKTYKSYIYIHM